jgi:hypothetical protein
MTPLAPVDFLDPHDQPTRSPARLWLILDCSHKKMVLESEKENYPIGRETLCAVCDPFRYRAITGYRPLGEAKA